MTEADIEKIIEAQGYTMHFDVRVKVRGDGTTSSYVHLRKRGMRGSLHLGTITKLLQMSEAGLVALIAEKTKKDEGKG